MNVGRRPGIRFVVPLIRFVVPLVLLAVLATATHAQNNDGVAGKWRTEAAGPGGTFVLLLQLQQDTTGRWIGTIRNSREPDRIQELQAVDVDGGDVRFNVETELPQQNVTVRSRFLLTLRPLENKLKGTVEVTAPGMQQERPVEFDRVVEKAGASEVAYQSARPLVGAWSAEPDEDDEERELQIEILPDGEEYRGTLTDTGIDETVALRDLTISDNSLSYNFRFEGAPFMSSFWGRYDPDQDQIRGSMSIGGRSQRMSFERTSPGPDDIPDEFGTEKKPLPKKHAFDFAVTGRAAYWVPLYIMKDNVRNINDITTPSFAWDVGLRYHLTDYLAVQVRYLHGGVGFDTNETNLGLFDPVDGPQGAGLSRALTTDSYLAMDSIEFQLVGYVGQNWFPTSRFNPYFIAAAGRTSWELTASGRGSETVAIFERSLDGSDWTFGGGLGTEYAFGDRFGLEAEWLWAYTLTGDDTVWTDTTYQWTNQHVFRFSLGLIARF
jgi:hypothetical protein